MTPKKTVAALAVLAPPVCAVPAAIGLQWYHPSLEPLVLAVCGVWVAGLPLWAAATLAGRDRRLLVRGAALLGGWCVGVVYEWGAFGPRWWPSVWWPSVWMSSRGTVGVGGGAPGSPVLFAAMQAPILILLVWTAEEMGRWGGVLAYLRVRELLGDSPKSAPNVPAKLSAALRAVAWLAAAAFWWPVVLGPQFNAMLALRLAAR